MARAVQHQAALLLGSLGWHKPHVGPGDCLANGLCVSRVILLPLDVGLHIGRRHQPHGVTQCLEFARPMVRRGAGLYANQARRQLLEERQDIATLQLAADDHLAGGINAVNLKDRLGDIETDCRNRLHDWILRIVRASTAPPIHGTRVPVEEPSTASEADICTHSSITSSAVESSTGGSVTPSALAVSTWGT